MTSNSSKLTVNEWTVPHETLPERCTTLIGDIFEKQMDQYVMLASKVSLRCCMTRLR